MKQILALAVTAVLAVGACGSENEPPADAGVAMCDYFAQHVDHDMSEAERAEMVDHLNQLAEAGGPSRTTRYLARYDAVGYLERTVDSPAWEMGADLFAATCFDAGWTG